MLIPQKGCHGLGTVKFHKIVQVSTLQLVCSGAGSYGGKLLVPILCGSKARLVGVRQDANLTVLEEWEGFGMDVLTRSHHCYGEKFPCGLHEDITGGEIIWPSLDKPDGKAGRHGDAGRIHPERPRFAGTPERMRFSLSQVADCWKHFSIQAAGLG